MKNEKTTVGIIMAILGIILLIWGYQKMQPDSIERGLSFLNDLSESFGGETIPLAYQRDKTEAIIFMLVGGVLAILGIRFILKNNK